MRGQMTKPLLVAIVVILWGLVGYLLAEAWGYRALILSVPFGLILGVMIMGFTAIDIVAFCCNSLCLVLRKT